MANQEDEYFVSKCKVLRCRCYHDFQDKRYGRMKRLHNPTGRDGAKHPDGWRCTVCGDKKT